MLGRNALITTSLKREPEASAVRLFCPRFMLVRMFAHLLFVAAFLRRGIVSIRKAALQHKFNGRLASFCRLKRSLINLIIKKVMNFLEHPIKKVG